ncbi:MAG: hypothetical protein NVSMB39_4190 [Candidatus Saccharimonadales bacterium]
MLRRGKALSPLRMVLSAALALVAFMPGRAAAAVQGIGLSPTSQDLSLAPGESYTSEITVINDGDRDVNYKISASDYHVDGESYTGIFSSSAAAANVSPVTWFTLPTGTFTARSRQQTKFNYTLKAPAGATVGGHYGAIFIETVPPPASASALIARVERIGSLMYIAVKGDLKRSGSVMGLSVPPLQAVGPVQAALRLQNDGNVHFLAEGTAQLSNPFGDVGKPVPFKGEVLPGTTRRFDLTLPASSAIGLYKVTATVKYIDRTEIISHWTLLMPRITFVILSGTILLLLAILTTRFYRRTKRRRS